MVESSGSSISTGQLLNIFTILLMYCLILWAWVEEALTGQQSLMA